MRDRYTCPSLNIGLWVYADDTVIIGLIINNDIVNYQKQVSDVVSWCTSHSLILNVKKTKQLIFDFSKSTPYHEPLTIQGCDVEICNQFKYLGVVIDDQLSWSYHSDLVVSKCKQKLFFLRLLKSFNVNSTILYRFYTSLTESVINYNCITWWVKTYPPIDPIVAPLILITFISVTFIYPRA